MNIIKDVLKWLKIAKPEWGKSKVSFKEKNLVKSIIQEEVDELFSAMDNNDKGEMKDAIVDIFWVALNAAALYGISENELQDFVNKVSESNWSKFCDKEEDAIDTVVAYASGTHFDKPDKIIDTYYKKIGDKYVIFRKDGKIMKSINYFKV